MNHLSHDLQGEGSRMNKMISWQTHQGQALQHAIGAERQFGRVSHTLQGSSEDYANHLDMLGHEVNRFNEDHGYYGHGYDSMTATVDGYGQTLHQLEEQRTKMRLRYKSDLAHLDEDGHELDHEEKAMQRRSMQLKKQRKALE